MRSDTVYETFVKPMSFPEFHWYANNNGIDPDTILDKWLELPVWDLMEDELEYYPGIRKLTVVRRV